MILVFDLHGKAHTSLRASFVPIKLFRRVDNRPPRKPRRETSQSVWRLKCPPRCIGSGKHKEGQPWRVARLRPLELVENTEQVVFGELREGCVLHLSAGRQEQWLERGAVEFLRVLLLRRWQPRQILRGTERARRAGREGR